MNHEPWPLSDQRRGQLSTFGNQIRSRIDMNAINAGCLVGGGCVATDHFLGYLPTTRQQFTFIRGYHYLLKVAIPPIMNHGSHGKWHSWRDRFSHVFPFHDWNRKGALSTATYSTPAISSPIVVIVEKATGLKKQKTKKNMTWQVKVSLGRNEPEIIRNWAAARASILRPQIGWGKIFFQHVYWKRCQKLHSRMSSLNLFAFSSQSLLKTALASPIRTRYVLSGLTLKETWSNTIHISSPSHIWRLTIPVGNKTSEMFLGIEQEIHIAEHPAMARGGTGTVFRCLAWS